VRRQAGAAAHVTIEHATTTRRGIASAAMRPLSSVILPTPIVAFAKDWHEDPTSNHHVLRELARTRRVLWLNSLATRTPSLASGRDLGKIARKLREFAKGAKNVENDLWVATPLVLPLPGNRTARAINRKLLRAYVRMLRLQLGIDDFELWTFLPTTADYIGTLGEQLSVYYCVDEWSLFSYLDKEQTAEAERQLLARVDVVFAINDALAASKRSINRATFVSPHGVDHDLFSRALDDATLVPPISSRCRGRASGSTARCATGSTSSCSPRSPGRGRRGRSR